jgi:HPt (histidine-containing phosphotransfer) domain-containing protein
MFVDEIPEITEQLKNVVNKKDSEEIRKKAHYLKGSAAMIGLDIISGLSAKLESSGKEKTLENTEKLLEELIEELELSKKLIKEL